MTIPVMKYFSVALLSVMWLLVAACSTGIEGTKTIKMSRAERRETQPTPEELFARPIVSAPVSEWKPGKRFLIVDEKARLIFDMPSVAQSDSVTGHVLKFEDVELRPNPGGKDVVVLRFNDGGNTVRFRTSRVVGSGEFDITGLDIPMTVDLDLVQLADSLLKGKSFWTRSRLWYDSDMAPYYGRKFVPVTVTCVHPGNQHFPLTVDFMDESGEKASFMMNVKAESGLGAESRTLPTLFSMTDPKASYPSIQPEIWDNIRNGKVSLGMTKEECKLALGNPTDVDTGHTWGNLVEVWSYKDGKFLYFEDGRLTNFRN